MGGREGMTRCRIFGPAPPETRRNPDLTDDLIILVGVGAAVVLLGQWLGQRAQEAAAATGVPQIVAAVGNAPAAVFGGQPGCTDVCKKIADFRANPPSVLPGLFGQAASIFGIVNYQYNTSSWIDFRAYSKQFLGCDPGDTPPDCW